MDVKDLMIGDLVTFKECQNDENPMPIEIVALGYQQGGGRESSLVSINGDKACDIFDIDDEIVGIPLTPEILKKNGFKWLADEKGGRKTHICNERSILVTWMKDHYMLSIGPVGSPKMPFVEVGWAKYVHELQHALRLCCTNKEIEL